MFIRVVKKQRSKDSKVFHQFQLVQSARINGKSRQRVILYAGSDPVLLDKQKRLIVLNILKSKIFGQQELFPLSPPEELLNLGLALYEKYGIKYGDQAGEKVGASIPPAIEQADYQNIDIKGMEVQDVRTFGSEHLCKQVLSKLELDKCFEALGMNESQKTKSLISIAGRAIFAESEYKTSQILQMNSELASCYNYDKPLTHKQLYAISDLLYTHKSKIDSFLYRRITDMFDLKDNLVIFDISNTYFETRKADSKLAKHGRSKEKRNDCPIVVFTGVINAEGFIRHSRIYEGNKSDAATLFDMIEDLEKYSSSTAQKTVVIDAGIATEDNLTLLRKKGYKYVCVSRKRLKDYPVSTDSPKKVQLTDRGKNKVELEIFTPKGYSDIWMYVQSEAKRRKEQSMEEKLEERFIEEIQSIGDAFGKKGGTKRINKVWERIGRAKQKHKRVSGRFNIYVKETDGVATQISWKKKKSKVTDDKSKGVYFIRTNYENPDEEQLWQIYNTIREVESTFRCLKSDLNIRPVHHQKDERIEAHIYLTILAYQLVNTIRYRLKKVGLHYDWKSIVRIMSTQTIQTIQLPGDKKITHLRKPAKPIQKVQQIYKAIGCNETQTAVKKYVVYH